jgi:hypothetical protein
MTTALPRRPILGLKNPVIIVLPPELQPRAAKAPASTSPIRSNTMTPLTGKSLKVTIPLDAGELAALRVPDGQPRTILRIKVGGREIGADVASKSVRKVIATVREAGVENSFVMLQGKLDLAAMAVVEAGIVAQVKAATPGVDP